MKVYLIRHSLTEGNLQKRYIGKTDQPLCEEGRNLVAEKLGEGRFQNLKGKSPLLFSSPMKRCKETMELLFPGQSYQEIQDLRECDFGIFENKNYKELTDLPEYQAWIDSNGTLPFPEGESREGFNLRTEKAFAEAVAQCESAGIEEAVFTVHGGSIMAIMDSFTQGQETYYDFMVENLSGYVLYLCNGRILEYDKLK